MKMRKLTIALLVAAAAACTKSEDVVNSNIPVDYGVIKMSYFPHVTLAPYWDLRSSLSHHNQREYCY